MTWKGCDNYVKMIYNDNNKIFIIKIINNYCRIFEIVMRF